MDNFESTFSNQDASYYWLLWIAGAYLLAEAIFAVLVYYYWIPKLNKPKTPPIIRNFEDHSLRHKLFERMLNRQEDLCNALGVDMKAYFTQFMGNWFFVVSDEDDVVGEDSQPLSGPLRQRNEMCQWSVAFRRHGLMATACLRPDFQGPPALANSRQ